MAGENNCLCKKHDGVERDLKHLRESVRELWAKWDSMQKWVIGACVALIMNLVGVILLLIRISAAAPN